MPVKKVKRTLMTITDLANLFMATIYIVFVSLMLMFGLGTTWLNIGMMTVTLLYALFLIIKLMYLDKIGAGAKLKRTTKRLFRLVKYGMKGVNAVFVILGLLAVRLGPSHIIPMMGVIVFVLTLLFSISYDIILYFIRRKIKSILSEWKELDKTRKKEKIDFLIERFLQSLDDLSLSGYEDYIEYGSQAGIIVADKFKSAKKTELLNPPVATE